MHRHLHLAIRGSTSEGGLSGRDYNRHVNRASRRRGADGVPFILTLGSPPLLSSNLLCPVDPARH